MSITSYNILSVLKGQLISKENCQAVNSSKKRIDKLVFTTMRCVFVPFLEEEKLSKLSDL